MSAIEQDSFSIRADHFNPPSSRYRERHPSIIQIPSHEEAEADRINAHSHFGPTPPTRDADSRSQTPTPALAARLIVHTPRSADEKVPTPRPFSRDA